MISVNTVQSDSSYVPSTAKFLRGGGKDLFVFKTEMPKDEGVWIGEGDSRVYIRKMTGVDIERFQADFSKPFSVTANNGLNRDENSVSLVNGVNIKTRWGNLSVRTSSLSYIIESKELEKTADGLQTLIKWANGDFRYDVNLQSLYHLEPENQSYVVEALQSAGLDTSKPFVINNAKFEIVDGVIRKI